MTDLKYALPLMNENVQRNKQSWQGKDNMIGCKECDWYHPPPITELCGSSSVASNNSSDAMIDDDGIVCSVDVDGDIDGHEKHPIQYPDVILVADCVWLAQLIAPLLNTLKTYTTESTKVIITYQRRGKEAHEEFWEGIHDVFDVVAVDTEKTVELAKPDVFYVLECRKKER